MGFGYKGDTGHYHTLGENAASLKESYKFNPNTGYFGDKGDSPRSSVRHIESEDPLKTAKDFYDKASYGGKEEKLEDGKLKTIMKDGTVLIFREISNSDGTPVVQINIQSSNNNGGIKKQKIHFVKKESKKDGKE
jgi:hypothetical protein